jgi:hypothetical protein
MCFSITLGSHFRSGGATVLLKKGTKSLYTIARVLCVRLSTPTERAWVEKYGKTHVKHLTATWTL